MTYELFIPFKTKMDEEKIKYRPSEFLKNNRDFFKNYSFKFEGLSPEHERDFTKIIKELGGKVSNEAKYTFVEKSYFEKVKSTKRKDFFHLNFILDSVNFGKILNIQLYRCDQTCDDFNSNSKIIKNNSDGTESSSSNESVKINQEANSTDYLEDFDSTSSSNEAGELSPRKRIKTSDLAAKTNFKKSVLQNKTNSEGVKRTWNKNQDINIASNSVILKSRIQEREDLKWLFRLDKNNLCSMQNCTFEPGPHKRHSLAGRVISDEEKMVILKYIITNDLILKAKGSTTWKLIHSHGYLTHRSPETLRNCMRRYIIPKIHKFGLPEDITLQFLQLERK